MSKKKSTYFANEGDVREKMRLERQARVLDKAVDVLAGLDLSSVHDVLGIACGTGSWLIQYAQQHPGSHIVGLDNDRGILNFARAQTSVAGINVDFQEGSALEPLKFPDASFDMVNMRMLMSFMRRDAWSGLLAECNRVTRPGGIVILTEIEDGATNDYQYEKTLNILYQAFHRAGHTFANSTEQQHLCTGIAFKRLLREAGFVNVSHLSHAVDFSYGEPAHIPVLENIASAFENGESFFMKMAGVTHGQLHEAQTHIKSLIGKEDFLGFWHFISAIGYKP